MAEDIYVSRACSLPSVRFLCGGEIKGGETEGKGEIVPFSRSHSSVFPQPGKHINPSVFKLGNKGAQPGCGRGRVIRSSGNSREGKSELQNSPGLHF